jgi:dihydrofolate reductase
VRRCSPQDRTCAPIFVKASLLIAADSVEAGIALARKLAGDGLVCVSAGDVGGQAFSAGLVDEVAMDVAPVVLGEGVRFFGGHVGTVLLDDPD